MAAVFLAGQIIAYVFRNDQYVLIVQNVGALIGCKPQNAVFHEDQAVAPSVYKALDMPNILPHMEDSLNFRNTRVG